MMTKMVVRFLLVTIVVAGLSFREPVAPALACTEPVGGHPVYSVAERTEAAGVVIVGMVVYVEGDTYFPHTAVIQVNQYLKGAGPPTIRITGFGSSALCLSYVYAGMHAIFFAGGPQGNSLSLFGIRGTPAATASATPTATPTPPPLYQAIYLSAFDATAPATIANIAEALAASGQEPLIWRYLYLPLILKQ